MSGEHPHVQPQFADPDFSPPEQPPAPHPGNRNAMMSPAGVPQPMRRSPVPRGSVETTDAQGRKITIRKLSALDRMDLLEALGKDLSDNLNYLANAMSAVCVTSIDGTPVPFPSSKKALRRLVEQLGDDGMEAAAKAYGENFGAGESGDKDEIKN